MGLADRLSLRLPRLDGSRNLLRDLWNLLSGMPGGKRVFSRLVGRMAPYTGTIHATVTVLRAGYAEVQMPDRRAVRNHLDSVHAIALANLAELAGNVALMYSLPDDARFIVSGLDIEYTKKARGTITAVGGPPHPRPPAPAPYPTPVVLLEPGRAPVPPGPPRHPARPTPG